MLVEKNGEITTECSTHHFETDFFSIYWEGFVYGFNKENGEKTIKTLIKEVEDRGFISVLSELRGVFVLAFKDKKKQEIFITTDISGQMPIYRTKTVVSSSLLKLAEKTGLRKENISLYKAVEFILTGFQFGSNALFDEIEKIPPQQFVHVANRNISLQNRDKKDDPFQVKKFDTSTSKFLQEWEILAKAVANEKVSVDLTGGTDSRIIVAILDYLGCSFETAISGTKKHPDVVISSKVSKQLTTHEHFVTEHNVNENDLIEDLLKIVNQSSGLTDYTEMHRLFLLEEGRKARGITLSIGGGAGELYKDGGQWRAALQSFYSKEKFINRFVDSGFACWGMEAQPPFWIFSNRVKSTACQYKTDTKMFLTRNFSNIRQSVFRLADMIFYKHTVASPRGFRPSFVTHYSPLLDAKFVQHGVNLPKMDRFCHRFYRKIIKNLDVEKRVSGLPTTRQGMTLLPGKEISEIVSSMHFRLKKKEKIHKSNQNIFRFLRKSSVMTDALTELKTLGLINPEAMINDIPKKYLGRIVSLWLFIKVLENKKAENTTSEVS